MAITTEAVAARLAARLAEFGVELTDADGFAAAFAADLADWVGGTEAVPVALANRVSETATAWNTDVMQRLDWWTGPADGGPNGDGLYPMVNAAGVETMFPSLAKIVSVTARGYSAYDLAVQAGYTGTEEEYATDPVVKAAYALTQGDYAKDQGDDALAAAAAANAARDVARFKAVYATRTALYDDLEHDKDTLGLVTDDATPAYNGTYAKAGASGAGSWNKVESLNGLIFQALAPETGYLFALVDASGRMGFGVRLDGSFHIPKFMAQTITQAAIALGAVGTQQLAAGAVDLSRLDQVEIAPFLAKRMDPSETGGFVYALVDALNRYALAIKNDGSVLIPKLVLATASITRTMLAPEISGYVAVNLPAETGYLWAVVDASNRIGLAIKTDGTVVGKFANSLTDGSVTTVKLAAGAVTEAKLDPPMARLAVPHVGDVIEVMPDAWRSKMGSVAARTEVNGSVWVQFPRFLTRALRGVNGSGASLDFRRSSGVMFRGNRQGSDWNPVAVAAVASTTFKGNTTDPSALSTSGRVAGDYYKYSVTSSTTTFDGQTVGLGDLIVYDGSAFKVQKAPAPVSGGYTSRERGDWWAVTADGTFDGVAYTAGDRIVCVGFDSQSGFGVMLWYKGQPSDGELFYRGEFDASAGTLPASATLGDVYQISVAGTLGAEAYAVGDYLVYDAGVWGAIRNGAVTTVAAGKMIPGLACVQSASEWEVRRTDKSNTRVGVSVGGRHQLSPRRSSDGIVCRGDSMPGVAALQTHLGALVAPRQVVTVSRGGGTSDNVLSTMEYEIAVRGDPYRGWFEFLWLWQNNQPSAVGDASWCRIIECGLRAAELVGARDSRFAFMTLLGTMGMTFNGERLVVTQWEGMKAGTHVLAKLEQWFATNFPGQVLNTREALLAKAATSTVPDPRVLGAMTEAETAATYGWVPYSWMNKNTAYSFSLASLNYVGWWSGAGTLPSGGADGDAHVRSGGATTIGTGGVGNLIVRQAGAWGEYAPDTIHIGGGASQGGPQLAAALNDFLNTNKL